MLQWIAVLFFVSIVLIHSKTPALLQGEGFLFYGIMNMYFLLNSSEQMTTFIPKCVQCSVMKLFLY